jgi:hypothetical protein
MDQCESLFTQLPGEGWPDQAVAQAATSAVDARLAHQLRFCKAEVGKAVDTAQQAEERMTRRDGRREKALAHNEVAATRRLELEASAETARAKFVEARQAITAGMAPEEVSAIDAARDTDRAALALVHRAQERARQGHQLDHGYGLGPRPSRGPDRDGPGLGQ